MNSLGNIFKIFMYVIVSLFVLSIVLGLAFFLVKILVILAAVGVVCWGVYKLYKFIKGKIEEYNYNKEGYKENNDGIIDVKYEDADDDDTDNR